MKYEVNDVVEYISDESTIRKGKVIQVRGFFKSMYVVKTKCKMFGPIDKTIEKVVLVNGKDIITKIKEEDYA